jgi:hypothetical protein
MCGSRDGLLRLLGTVDEVGARQSGDHNHKPKEEHMESRIIGIDLGIASAHTACMASWPPTWPGEPGPPCDAVGPMCCAISTGPK